MNSIKENQYIKIEEEALEPIVKPLQKAKFLARPGIVPKLEINGELLEFSLTYIDSLLAKLQDTYGVIKIQGYAHIHPKYGIRPFTNVVEQSWYDIEFLEGFDEFVDNFPASLNIGKENKTEFYLHINSNNELCINNRLIRRFIKADSGKPCLIMKLLISNPQVSFTKRQINEYLKNQKAELFTESFSTLLNKVGFPGKAIWQYFFKISNQEQQTIKYLGKQNIESIKLRNLSITKLTSFADSKE